MGKSFLFANFDIKKLGVVDEHAGNVLNTYPPYYILGGSNSGALRDKVIVFGNDYRKLAGVNVAKFVEIYNQCLDYIRRECKGCRLYFKPHPTSSDDIKAYNLRGFELINDKAVGELFLYKNLDQIKYVFSMGSTASLIAYSMGLNSYVLARLFQPAFAAGSVTFYDSFLRGMPDSFFISSLKQPLKENKTEFRKDSVFEKHFANLLAANTGTAWFIVVDPSFLLTMISLSKLIKKNSPGRKVNLAIMRHERWNPINTGELARDFDEIIFFPKVNYAFKLVNLKNIIKTVSAVKKVKINKGDILFGVGLCSFLENCFISYFKDNLSVAIATRQFFDFTHNFEPPLDSSDFRTRWTGIFFNNVIEPLLGLHKGVRLMRPSRKSGGNFTRYREAADKIFDVVYILKLN